jgi:hypothetical protein
MAPRVVQLYGGLNFTTQATKVNDLFSSNGALHKKASVHEELCVTKLVILSCPMQ